MYVLTFVTSDEDVLLDDEFLLNFRAMREAEILPVKFVENLLMLEEILSDSVDINLKVSRTAR